MQTAPSRFADEAHGQPQDFSLALGGPLFQLLRRVRLSDDALAMVKARVAVISLLAWLPLLVLSAWEGRMLGGDAAVTFLMDIDVHVKFLVVIPLLIVAELMVHRRLRPVVAQFVKQDLIPAAARARFDAAITSALRLRNSALAEVLLIAVVYGIGVQVIWRHYSILDTTTWYATPSPGGATLSLTGMWYGFVSLPIFQFLLIRWLFRLLIWARFLWRVSRLDLNLFPTHPDRVGGLGFLANTLPAFYPLAAAFGALLSGVLADRIFYSAASLAVFKAPLAAAIVLLVILLAGPLLVFTPRIAQAKWTGILEYGALAQRYARGFDARWMRGDAPAGDTPAGGRDILSIPDLANWLQMIQTMRIAPVTLQDIVLLAVAMLLPISPLLLTVMPLEEALKMLFGLLR